MDKWQFFERHFGAARLAHYLTEFDGDVDCAADLYVWNVAVSGEMWRALAFFEVAFRNSIDRAMSARHERLGRDGHWIFDDAREIGRDGNGPDRHRAPFSDVAQAKDRVRRNRKRLDAGQIVSELPFGFWHQMVSRKQLSLWPDIASVFVNAPNRQQVPLHGGPLPRPERNRTHPLGDALEAGVERVRSHLRRPHAHQQRQLNTDR